MKLLSVGELAARLGVHAQTIRRWCRNGLLKEDARTVGNHRRFKEEEVVLSSNKKVVGYARVSSHDQKSDLANQEKALTIKAASQNIEIDQIITDVGSGLNYKKKGFVLLLHLILTNQIFHLVIMHKDRLLRFGSEIIFALCKFKNIKVTILEEPEVKSPTDNLCFDLIEIITVFSSKLYGMRSHSNKKKLNAQL